MTVRHQDRGGLLNARLRKFCLTIQGHATSLTLEPVLWAALNDAAAAEGKSLAALVAEIDEARTTNLSSAIRVWLFERARERRAPDCST